MLSDKILLVDDEPSVLAGLKRSLGNRFNLETAGSAGDALGLIDRNGPYAVVISDMQMPEMNGLELLSQLASSHPETVRMMLTGNSDQQTAMDAVNEGKVFRFLAKPCSPEALQLALNQGLDEYRLRQQALAKAQADAKAVEALSAEIDYQLRHDLLTGLANRAAFELRIQSTLDSARLEDRHHVFCVLDIDHFHLINDSCGQTAGDELLRQISRILSHGRRSSDQVSRLGADQFGLILGDCSLDDGLSIIDKFHEMLHLFQFHWEEIRHEITLSVGLVPINADSPDVTELISQAETACNVAKDDGGNRTHLARPDDELLTRRLSEAQWVHRINHALDKGRFRLYYQPIRSVEGDSRAREHYEILLRMVDEKGGIVPPGKFLPAAEHYHLSPRLDRWVIEHTARWLHDNPVHLRDLSLCSINLSAHSIGDMELCEFIIQLFKKLEIPTKKICFEITETAAIDYLDRAIYFIGTLKAEGFLFALDDFGTGLSSFAYLKNLDVDYIKIDGAFVKEIDHNVIDWTMVKSINEMGHIMGKQVIAEFVENEAILNQLSDIGVDYAQGYFLGRPSPLDHEID